MAEASSSNSNNAPAASLSPLQTPIAKHISLSGTPVIHRPGDLEEVHDEDAMGAEEDDEHTWCVLYAFLRGFRIHCFTPQ